MGELPSPFALSSAAAVSIPSTFPSMAVPASRARESERKEDDQLVYRLNAEKHCRRSSGRARRGLLPMELQGCRQVRRMPSAQAHDKVPRGAAHQPGAEAGGAQGPGMPQGKDGPCSSGKRHPFLEILTRGAAAALAAAAFPPQHFGTPSVDSDAAPTSSKLAALVGKGGCNTRRKGSLSLCQTPLLPLPSSRPCTHPFAL